MKRALAIFAKTPLPGLVKTRLSPPLSLRESADLYRCMLFDTIARVGDLATDTIIFFDGNLEFFRQAAPEATLIPQRAGVLGARIEAAFDRLSEMGYGARAVIGTDAPDLPLEYVEDAFSLIEAGSDAVFGPAADGGYYLVAVKGSYGELFRDIPWSTDQVLAISLKRARACGLSAAQLPPWYDVDSFDDLSRPCLSDPGNRAPLTRRFISALGASVTAGSI